MIKVKLKQSYLLQCCYCWSECQYFEGFKILHKSI